MAALVNKITLQSTEFEFDDLQQPGPSTAQQLEIFIRPGIAGVGARRTGNRTKQVRMISIRYVTDFATARTLLNDYESLIGNDPVTIVQHSINLGSHYIVEHVMESRTFAVESAQGTLTQNPKVLMQCEWLLWG